VSEVTDWLDPNEMRLWRAFIEVSTRAMGRIEDDLQTDAGLAVDDYEVLVHLSEAPDRRLRMSELADRTLHSRSRLTHRIDRMVGDGLVAREACPEDRRGVEAVLTPKGRQILDAAAPGHLVSVRAALIDRFTDAEKPFVADALERVAAELRETD